MAKTEPSHPSTTNPTDPAAVEGVLRELDGEATTGEIASELGIRPSDAINALAKLSKWGVVTNPEGKTWRLTSIEEHKAVAEFEERASDVPCPSCGYRPMSARDAGRHLVRHLTGTHTTGEEQYRKRAQYVRE